MRLEIIDNEIKVELENVTIKDFSSIKQLKGEKILLEQAFQDTKKEILENYG